MRPWHTQNTSMSYSAQSNESASHDNIGMCRSAQLGCTNAEYACKIVDFGIMSMAIPLNPGSHFGTRRMLIPNSQGVGMRKIGRLSTTSSRKSSQNRRTLSFAQIPVIELELVNDSPGIHRDKPLISSTFRHEFQTVFRPDNTGKVRQ